MALIDTYRRAAQAGRRAADRAGIRLVTVAIITETWSAAHNTAGATLLSTATLVLSPRFKVVAESGGGNSVFGGGGLAESAGVLTASTFRVGPITRQFSGGGYTEAQLLPQPSSTSQRVYYTLDDGGDQFVAGGEKFKAVSIDTTTLHHTLIVQRTDQT